MNIVGMRGEPVWNAIWSDWLAFHLDLKVCRHSVLHSEQADQ